MRLEDMEIYKLTMESGDDIWFAVVEKENLVKDSFGQQELTQGSLQTNLPQSPLNLNQSQLNNNQSPLHRYQTLPNPYKSCHLSPLYSSPVSILLPAIVFLLLLFLYGCEKVIDVDLNESDPAIVIEGNLSQNEGVLEVKISKTTSYFDNEPLPKVENANVYLETGPGFKLQAEETEQGVYKLNNLPLKTNAVYRLTVRVDGEDYTAVSILPPLVKIDSLSYEYQQKQVFVEGGYRILLFFNDPVDKKNYYRVKLYRNGQRFDGVDDLIIFDDSNLDGKNIQVRLRGQLFEPGDTIMVELLSIDKNAWEYFSSLREVANLNPGSPSPANPLSNLSNGALGYFSAWASSTRELIISE